MESSDLKEIDPGGGFKFECGICSKKFSSTWCLQIHVRAHNEKRSFDCHECGKTFQDFSGLYTHLKQHIFGEESTDDPLHLCNICGKEYPRSQISMHKRTHVFKPGLTCKICGKSFGSSQVLKLHLRTHDKKTLHQCQICDLKFASRNSFALHWNSHATLEPPSFEKRSSSSRVDAKYTSSCRNQEASAINDSHVLFKQQSECEREEVHHSSIPTEEDLTCSECGEKFCKTEDFQAHQNHHIKTYAAGLLRILGSKQNMKFSLDPVLDAMQGTENLMQREEKTLTETCSVDESRSESAAPVITFEGSPVQNDSFEFESLHENDINGDCLSEHDIFVNNDNQSKKTMYHADVASSQSFPPSKVSHFESYLELQKCIMTKDNQIKCKICSKQFYSIERASTHVKNHLKKEDDTNCSVSKLPCLQTMTNAQCVNEPMEMRCLQSPNTDENHLINVSVKAQKDKLDIRSQKKLDALTSSSGKSSENEDLQINSRTAYSDVDRIEENASVSDVEYDLQSNSDYSDVDRIEESSDDEKEWVPTKLAETVTSDRLTSGRVKFLDKTNIFSEDDNDSITSLEAAAVVCNNEHDEEHENFIKDHNIEAESNKNEKEQDAVSASGVEAALPACNSEQHESLRLHYIDTESNGSKKNQKDDNANAMKTDVTVCNDSQEILLMPQITNTERHRNEKDPDLNSHSPDQSIDHPAQSPQSRKHSVGSKSTSNSNTFTSTDAKKFIIAEEGRYKCLKCHKSLCSMESAINHVKRHLQGPCFKCTKCSFATYTRHDLQCHFIKHTPSQKDMDMYSQMDCIATSRCSDDGASSLRAEDTGHMVSHFRKSFNVHEDDNPKTPMSKLSNQCRKSESSNSFTVTDAKKFIEEENGMYKCLKCDKRLGFMSTAIDHVKRHIQGPRFKCTKCSFATYKRYHLRRHFIQHKPSRKAMDMLNSQMNCIDNSKSSDVCAESVEIEHPDHVVSSLSKGFEVDNSPVHSAQNPTSKMSNHCRKLKCSKNISSRDVKKFIVEEEGRYKCLKCQKSLRSMQNAIKHVRRHLQGACFKCTKCSYATYTRHDLQCHFLKHKPSPKDMDMLNSQMGCINTSSSSNVGAASIKEDSEQLVARMNIVSDEDETDNSVQCVVTPTSEMKDHCRDESTSKTITSIESKKFIVEEDGVYKCLKCQKSVSSMVYAIKHVQRHFQGACFKCTKCSFATYSRHHLRRHFQKHNPSRKDMDTLNSQMDVIVRTPKDITCQPEIKSQTTLDEVISYSGKSPENEDLQSDRGQCDDSDVHKNATDSEDEYITTNMTGMGTTTRSASKKVGFQDKVDICSENNNGSITIIETAISVCDKGQDDENKNIIKLEKTHVESNEIEKEQHDGSATNMEATVPVCSDDQDEAYNCSVKPQYTAKESHVHIEQDENNASAVVAAVDVSNEDEGHLNLVRSETTDTEGRRNKKQQDACSVPSMDATITVCNDSQENLIRPQNTDTESNRNEKELDEADAADSTSSNESLDHAAQSPQSLESSNDTTNTIKSKTFTSSDAKKFVVEEDGMYKCMKCQKSVSSMVCAIKHVQRHFQKACFKCTKCSFATYTRHHLRRHFIKHENGNHCKKLKNSNNFTSTHAKKFIVAEDGMFKCLKCNKSLGCMSTAIDHVKRHIQGPCFKCTKCSFATYTRHHLQRHLIQHKPSRKAMNMLNSQMNCIDNSKSSDVCAESVEVDNRDHVVSSLSKGSEVDNSPVHSAQNPSSKMSNHCRKLKHSNKISSRDVKKFIVEEEGRYKCLKCQKSLRTMQNAIKHVRRHLQGACFKCTKCSYATYTRHDLQCHFLKHKPSQKDMDKLNSQMGCINTSSSSNVGAASFEEEDSEHLVARMNIVSDEDETDNRVQCVVTPTSEMKDHCRDESTSKTITSIESKKFIVEEDGVYKCLKCQKSVSSMVYAIKHVQRHFQGACFKCTQCSFATYSRHHLRRHFQRHNPSRKDMDTLNSQMDVIVRTPKDITCQPDIKSQKTLNPVTSNSGKSPEKEDLQSDCRGQCDDSDVHKNATDSEDECITTNMTGMGTTTRSASKKFRFQDKVDICSENNNGSITIIETAISVCDKGQDDENKNIIKPKKTHVESNEIEKEQDDGSTTNMEATMPVCSDDQDEAYNCSVKPQYTAKESHVHIEQNENNASAVVAAVDVSNEDEGHLNLVRSETTDTEGRRNKKQQDACSVPSMDATITVCNDSQENLIRPQNTDTESNRNEKELDEADAADSTSSNESLDHAAQSPQSFESSNDTTNTIKSKTFTSSDAKKFVVEEDGMYKCMKCQKSVSSMVCAIKHVQRHFQKACFKCTKCSFATYTRHHLRRHFIKHENGNDCKKLKSSNNFTSTDAKKFIIAEDGMFKCLKCNKSLGCMSTAIDHVKRHIQGPCFKCTKCSFATYTRHHLQRHLIQHKPSRKAMDMLNSQMNCIDNSKSSDVCAESVEVDNPDHVVSSLSKGSEVDNSPVHSVQNPSSKMSNHCRKLKRSNKISSRDVKKFIVEEEGRYKCLKCQKGLRSMQNAIKHVRRHLQGACFKCTKCSYATYTRHDLQCHFLKHKPSQKDMDMLNSQMGCINTSSSSNVGAASFEEEDSEHLVARMNIVSDEDETDNRVQCVVTPTSEMKDHCRDESTSKSITSIESKKFIVEEDGVYKCLKCEKSVSSMVYAIKHVQRHFQGACFKCTKCSFATYSRHHLRRHFQRHNPSRKDMDTLNSQMDVSVRTPKDITCQPDIKSQKTLDPVTSNSGKSPEKEDLQSDSRGQCDDSDVHKNATDSENECITTNMTGMGITTRSASKKFGFQNKADICIENNNGSITIIETAISVCDKGQDDENKDIIKPKKAHVESNEIEKEQDDGSTTNMEATMPVCSDDQDEVYERSGKSQYTAKESHVHIEQDENTASVMVAAIDVSKDDDEGRLNLIRSKTTAIETRRNQKHQDACSAPAMEATITVCNDSQENLIRPQNTDTESNRNEKKLDEADAADSTSSNESLDHAAQSPQSLESSNDTTNTIKSKRFTSSDAKKFVVEEDGMYKCMKCQKSVSSMVCAIKHVQRHFQKACFKCTKCSFATYTRHHLRRHFIKHENGNHCKKLKSSNNFTSTHAKKFIVAEDGMFKCLKCQKSLGCMSTAIDHVKRHIQGPCFKCTKCSFATFTEHHLRRHFIKHKSSKKDADMLNSQMDCIATSDRSSLGSASLGVDNPDHSDASLSKGSELRENDNPSHCVETPTSDTLTRSDAKKFIVEENGMYKCLKCQKSVNFMLSAIKHVQRHFQEVFKCPRCLYSTYSKHHLRRHFNHHNPSDKEIEMLTSQINYKGISHRRDVNATTSRAEHQLVSDSHIDSKNYVRDVAKDMSVIHDDKDRHILEDKENDHFGNAEHFSADQKQAEVGPLRKDTLLPNNMDLDLANHKKQVHEKVLTFPCDECGKQFATKNVRRQHTLTHQQKCPTLTELGRHQTDRKKEVVKTPHRFELRKDELQCELCGRHFKTSVSLEIHRLLHQALEEIGEDKRDGRSFKLKQSLRIKCPKCKKECRKLLQLYYHLSHHFQEKSHKCDICELAFHCKNSLLVHQNMHNNYRPYQCELCPRAFYSKDRRTQHVKARHQKKVKQEATCDICGKKLAKTSIRDHKIRHDKDRYVKTFPCEQCGKKFYSACQVKAHLKTHLDELVAMCDICGKSLKSKNSLMEHLKGHTGEKPFKCGICDKSFKLKQWLKRHLRVHTGEKPYVCDICNKAFNEPETLKNHRYIHTGEKPYKCHLCGERFQDRWARHKHVKRHGI